MKKYIQAYMNGVRGFMSSRMGSAPLSEIQEVLGEFETKILYFQHERLIHLIVTVLFALLEMMSIFVCLVSPSLSVIVFCVMFLVLLVPYIMHYYFLENSVQEMYKMRDELKSCLEEKKKL